MIERGEKEEKEERDERGMRESFIFYFCCNLLYV